MALHVFLSIRNRTIDAIINTPDDEDVDNGFAGQGSGAFSGLAPEWHGATAGRAIEHWGRQKEGHAKHEGASLGDHSRKQRAAHMASRGGLGTPPTGDTAGLASRMAGLRDGDPKGHALLVQYLREGGENMDPSQADWCAAFVAASVRKAGGTPPSGADVATAWARYGKPVAPSDVKRGDIVVTMRGHSPGEMGGHVAIATGPAKDGEIPVIAGDIRADPSRGGHGHHKADYDTEELKDVIVRRPADTSVAKAPISSPGSPDLPAGLRNNNPGNIKYVGQEDALGPSENTDQGDPQAVYRSMGAGTAAMESLIKRKYAAGKTNSYDMIAAEGGWTPGNVEAAANVARSAGVGLHEDLNITDPARLTAFRNALILQEQGPAGFSYYEKAMANGE